MRNLMGGAFERPTFTFQSVSLDTLDLEGVTVSLHCRIDNPNSVGLELARLGYALDLEGRRAVAGELAPGLDIPARGSAPLALPVRLRFQDVPGILEILVARDAASYRITGHAGVNTPVGIMDFSFEHQGRAAVPRLISLR